MDEKMNLIDNIPHTKMTLLLFVAVLIGLHGKSAGTSARVKCDKSQKKNKKTETEELQVEDGDHMLSTIHDISTNNIGSLCYHNTYK